MDSSQSDQSLISEDELSRLRRTRVSLLKASDLIGRSYPSTRKLVEDRRLITINMGGRKHVTLYEIRRFLEHGNATPQDWAEFEGSNHD